MQASASTLSGGGCVEKILDFHWLVGLAHTESVYLIWIIFSLPDAREC